MKFLTYVEEGRFEVGAYCSIKDEVYSLSSMGLEFADMQELIVEFGPQLREKIENGMKKSEGMPYAQIKKAGAIPYPSSDIICLGMNYLDHAKENAADAEEKVPKEKAVPIYFSKRAQPTVGDGEPIDGHFDIVSKLDYEVELAVIIGKEAYKVPEAEVRNHIFGYSIFNDVSARNLQTAHGQWYFGKSLDGFSLLGPWIVTEDEIPFPPKLDLKCRVNGELRQNSNTSLLITSIESIISELSRGIRLRPGTVIATGTPFGIGIDLDPPKFLKAGDVIECSIEKIGTLTNTVAG